VTGGVGGGGGLDADGLFGGLSTGSEFGAEFASWDMDLS
jgi:hypothetical protein